MNDTTLKTMSIPNTKGGCTTEPYTDWIEIVHFHRSFRASSQNGTTGRASIEQFEPIIRQDRSSAALHRALFTGTVFDRVVIEVSISHKNNKRIVLQRYTLYQVQIMNIASASLADGGDGESIVLNFAKMTQDSLLPENASAGSVTHDFPKGVTT